MSDRAVDISAVVPVTTRFDEPSQVYGEYRRAIAQTGRSFEFIYVLDGEFPALEGKLQELQAAGEPIGIIRLTQRFGEAVCLQVGLQRARGSVIATLPPYFQVEPASIPRMLAALDRVDVVAASRDRRDDHRLSRLRYGLLNRAARVAGAGVGDIGCLVRMVRRRVFDDIVLHDENHRFLPLLAQQAGYVVEEMVVPQARSDRRFRAHRPSTYVARLLDIVSVAFLMRFMQRPFRFFGTVGALMAALGLVGATVLAVQRIVYGVPLAERPALLLAAMLVVLGIQIGAVGLIAEMIIFARAGRLATYHVDQVVEAETAPVQVERPDPLTRA